MKWLAPYRMDEVDLGSGKVAPGAPEPSEPAPGGIPAEAAAEPGWLETVLIAASRMWAGAW
jgi:hypothetical protein